MLCRAIIPLLLALWECPAPAVPEDTLAVPGPSSALFAQYRLVARDVLGRRCVYRPSCSRYAQEVVDRLGPLLGASMAVERWTRCHSSARRGRFYPAGSDGLLLDPPFGSEGKGGGRAWSSLALPF